MPDFLTRRNGTWHFVRRVPTEFALIDRRGVIRHSTKIRTADDRAGRRASCVALRLNEELEAFWRQSVNGPSAVAAVAYEAAWRRARSLGFDYVELPQLVQLPPAQTYQRLDALVDRGLENDPGARAALLGIHSQPALLLSTLLNDYETFTKEETQQFSPKRRKCPLVSSFGVPASSDQRFQ